MRGPTKNAALPTVASLLQIWSQWVENWTVFTITRPICWKKTIGNNRRADRRGDQCTVRVAVATGALISGNGFGSLRRSIANDRPLEGPASAPTQARLLVRHNHGGSRPEPAACVAWVLKLPYTLTSEN